jgi:hypothetical protein
LQTLESNGGYDVLRKSALFYNKFSNKTGEKANIDSLRQIGGVSRLEHMTTEQIIQRLVTKQALAPIIGYLTDGDAQ